MQVLGCTQPHAWLSVTIMAAPLNKRRAVAVKRPWLDKAVHQCAAVTKLLRSPGMPHQHRHPLHVPLSGRQ